MKVDEVIDEKLILLPESVLAQYDLPQRFTFPFCYEPHPLTLFAAEQLQQYLRQEAAPDHNFGLDEARRGLVIGKMFGVLLVQDRDGRIGYLSAFSGKLAGTNNHARFVPPVFDMLREGSFFLKGQEEVSALNAEVDLLEQDERVQEWRRSLERISEEAACDLSALKVAMKGRKRNRDAARREGSLPESVLVEESLHDKRIFREATQNWAKRISGTEMLLRTHEERVERLKQERRLRSAALQEELFRQYAFLNQYGVPKSLHEIFSATAFGRPPSAAGECATPKLLQYSFLKGYRPLAMAEFWWGASPKSEIRKHGQFYPACTGKCKPILAHMLEGIPLDENILQRPFENKEPLPRVYEDESMVLINKPSGLRSVPGVGTDDSAYTRLKAEMSGTELWVVHRLDMDTSGLLLFAKTTAVHRHLQKQFLRRVVHKRYVALLDADPPGDSGRIELPLTADPFDRPRQMVCYKTGKPSLTEWHILERQPDGVRVLFVPHTGRTHQLRMHAAHPLGLASPIKGDDLYGNAAARLYLHATAISFAHPLTKELLHFEIPVPF